MAKPLCIRCQKRPIMGKPWSYYLCLECSHEVKQAAMACSCSCHDSNPTPAMCCTQDEAMIPHQVLRIDGGACG